MPGLYHIGVDALIVQDMESAEMSLPDCAFMRAQQCDIRDALKKQGFFRRPRFSQLVLARELSLKRDARNIDAVDVPVECFVHGHLCVSYSGKMQRKVAHSTGRTPTVGNAPKSARLPFSLMECRGKCHSPRPTISYPCVISMLPH